jgi:uncharacterized protein (DUF433 family)
MQAFEATAPPLIEGDDGVIRIAGTRVQLETVVDAFDAGATAEEIAQQYPSLDLRSVYAVISYLLTNRGTVDAYMEKRRIEAAEIRKAIEERFPPEGVRARLLARRSNSQ